MRMIPSVLLQRSSTAEATLFDILRDSNPGEHWTAFHSLNCSEHAYKHWAEIDFLIACPYAILVLEIKGGRVRCKDGVWTYIDRFGRSRTNAEGPYGQARSVMYALQHLLKDRYHLPGIALGKIPFGFGVLFPDIDWDVDSPEAPAVITADRSMLMSASSVTRYLQHLVEYWRGKIAGAGVLNPEELTRLRTCLRPDVDVYPPLTQAVGVALKEMQHLTEEQYERLECLELNERAIISGGAGTGKTYLLMQYARRCAARGARVLVVVRSPILAVYMRKAVGETAVAIATLESLTRQRPTTADVLLVDEGQDLMDMDALAEIAACVNGGLDEGRWCWFMDDNNQRGVSGSFDTDAFEYLKGGLTTGAPIRLPLRRNCRNTKEIVRQVQLWLGADIGVSDVSGFGTRPQLVEVVDQDAATRELTRILTDVMEAGAEAGDIGLIIGDEGDSNVLQALPARMRRLLTPLSIETVAADLKGRILWGPADRFKGLERPFICVLALGEASYGAQKATLYVSMTRANCGLWVIALKRLASDLAAEQSRNLRRFSSMGG